MPASLVQKMKCLRPLNSNPLPPLLNEFNHFWWLAEATTNRLLNYLFIFPQPVLKCSKNELKFNFLIKISFTTSSRQNLIQKSHTIYNNQIITFFYYKLSLDYDNDRLHIRPKPTTNLKRIYSKIYGLSILIYGTNSH